MKIYLKNGLIPLRNLYMSNNDAESDKNSYKYYIKMKIIIFIP